MPSRHISKNSFVKCARRSKYLSMGKRYRFQGLPKSGSRDKQRCGAKLHRKLAACRRWPVPGRTRCRLHGGMSTGARTPEGKARVLAALIEGRQRWLQETREKKKAGLIARFPGGRKPGHQWVTPRMRQREMETARWCSPPCWRSRPCRWFVFLLGSIGSTGDCPATAFARAGDHSIRLGA